MGDDPARPPVRLQYLLWDGTDPVDSFALGNGLHASFRCLNMLDDSPASEEFVSTARKGKPRVYQPAGPDGKTISPALWNRGMFEFPLTFFDAGHHNAGDDRPHILAYSGHGIPGFMFSESSVLICASNPVAGTVNSFTFSPRPWNHVNTKLVIFSACRQLAGRPQQFRWARTMRGANKVHAILTYRNTAPAAITSAAINKSFIANLAKGQTFVKAWENAHAGGSLRRRWAALCYKSAVGDRLDLWAKTGSLSSAPADDEDILYFDSDNTSGRVVTRPVRILNCTPIYQSGTVTPSGLSAGDVVPPWTILRRDTKLHLDLQWEDATQAFQDGDTVWLAAMQVRPDYHGPFAIQDLFAIDLPAAVAASGDVISLGRIHDESAGWEPDNYTDLYQFQIKRAGMSWLTHDATWNKLTIPITIKGRPNDHLPVFYIMLRVARGATEFGIPTTVSNGLTVADQSRLVDDFQFFAFLVANVAT